MINRWNFVDFENFTLVKHLGSAACGEVFEVKFDRFKELCIKINCNLSL